MKRLSEKLTEYVVRSGAILGESYAVYQYGFQIGLEMLCCLIASLSIAAYLHMISEFVVFTGIFMMLRTYAGGIHLSSYTACFVCSVSVQTFALMIGRTYVLPIDVSWLLVIICSILIWVCSPIETAGRELDDDEKRHCRTVTVKILTGILLFSIYCTLGKNHKMRSLIALTVFIVCISQYLGLVKHKIENSKNMRK